MATATPAHPEGRPTVARVDYLVDENGAKLDVPDDSEVTVTHDVERAVASTSPTNWWQISLVGLGIVALIILLLQLFGGTPGTDVQPGTPTAEVQQPAATP
jgi:hypothetical protein